MLIGCHSQGQKAVICQIKVKRDEVGNTLFPSKRSSSPVRACLFELRAWQGQGAHLATGGQTMTDPLVGAPCRRLRRREIDRAVGGDDWAGWLAGWVGKLGLVIATFIATATMAGSSLLPCCWLWLCLCRVLCLLRSLPSFGPLVLPSPLNLGTDCLSRVALLDSTRLAFAACLALRLLACCCCCTPTLLLRRLSGPSSFPPPPTIDDDPLSLTTARTAKTRRRPRHSFTPWLRYHYHRRYVAPSLLLSIPLRER